MKQVSNTDNQSNRATTQSVKQDNTTSQKGQHRQPGQQHNQSNGATQTTRAKTQPVKQGNNTDSQSNRATTQTVKQGNNTDNQGDDRQGGGG